MEPATVVCLGDLVEDVVVLPDGPIRVGTDTTSRVVRCAGGSAANVARAVAALGGRSRLVARVGDDPTGSALRQELRDAGVEACLQVGGRTGTVVVLVDERAERTMLTDRGAAAGLDALPAGWDLDLAHLHLPLYSFDGEPMAGVAGAAAAAAQRAGATVSVDLSSVELLERVGPDGLAAVLGAARPTLVFANAEEDALAGPLPWAVVVKRGPEPVVLRAPGGAVTAEVPVAPVAGVVDTTGAGDAFAAGVLVALRQGRPWRDVLEAGIRAAAATLRSAGASPARIASR